MAFKGTVLLSVFATICAGERIHQSSLAMMKGPEQIGELDKLKELFKDSTNRICGGQAIRQMLTANPTARGIRSTNWGEIKATAHAYIDKESQKIPLLRQEIELLQTQLAEAEKGSAPQDLSEDALLDLLKRGVEGDDNFISLDVATEMKCGSTDDLDRKEELKFNIMAFENAEDSLRAVAEEQFDGKFRTTAEDFQNVCLKAFGVEEGADNYCDDFCLEMGDDLQQISEDSAGSFAGPSPAELREKIRAQQAQLAESVNELEECQQADASLQVFGEQMAELKNSISTQSSVERDARRKLNAAEINLKKLSDEAEDQEEIVAMRIQELLENTEKADKLSNLLDQIRKAEAAIKKDAKQAEGLYSEALDALKKALAVNQAVANIKARVAEISLNMYQYFEDSVLLPLAAVGLGRDTELDQYYRDITDMSSVDKQVGLTGALQNLNDFCENRAKPAFKLVQGVEGADLPSLCNFGLPDVEAIATDLQEQVGSIQTTSIETLKHAQSWLDPWKNSLVAEGDIKERLAKTGEPANLRGIMVVFGNGAYYRSYLKHWKYVNAAKQVEADRPYFLNLIDQLSKSIEVMTEVEARLGDSLKHILEEQENKIALRKETADLLTDALSAQEVSRDRESEAQEALSFERECISQGKSDLAALREAHRLAQESLRAAKELLVETHKGLTA